MESQSNTRQRETPYLCTGGKPFPQMTERSFIMRLLLRILAPLALAFALLAPAGAANAAPANSERFQTFVFDFNTCNGEFIQGEGTIHIVSKEQKDGTFVQHVQVHAKGIGSQGNEYVLNWNEKFQTNGFDFESKGRQMAISKGSAPNQVINFYFNSATNEFIIDTECRG